MAEKEGLVKLRALQHISTHTGVHAVGEVFEEGGPGVGAWIKAGLVEIVKGKASTPTTEETTTKGKAGKKG